MNKTTIKLTLTIEEEGKPVTYTLAQSVYPHEFDYVQKYAEVALQVMLSGLLAAPRIKSIE